MFVVKKSLFDNFVNDFTNNAVGLKEATITPNSDVYEDEKNIFIHIDIPGVSKDDIKMIVEKNTIKISGERQIKYNEGIKMFYRERVAGKFEKSFSINVDVDFNIVEAEYSNGVLSIIIPKVVHVPEVKEIKIK